MTLRSRGMVRNILKIIGLMIVGMMIGGGAGLGYHFWVMAKQESIPPVIRKPVVTVDREIGPGEILTDEDLKIIEVEEELIPLGAFTNPEEIIGKKAWINLTPKVILQPALFYQNRPELMENEQEIVLHKLPDNLQSGDYVDVRIQFPSGHDYCVLSHKQVSNFWQEKNMISLGLSEPERVRMGSAQTDVATYERAYLYLTIYPQAVDMPDTTVRYPVSGSVQGLYEEVASSLLPGEERKHLELALLQLKQEEKFLEAQENAQKDKTVADAEQETANSSKDRSEVSETEIQRTADSIDISREEAEKLGQGGENNF